MFKMVVKKSTKVRASMGRLDDATHLLVNFLFSLKWSIYAIAKECYCDWHTVEKALTSLRPSQRPKPLPPRIPTHAKATLALRRKRLKLISEIMETKVGPPPNYYVYSKKKFQSCKQIAKEYKVRHGGDLIPKTTVLRDLNAAGKVAKTRGKGPKQESTDPYDRKMFSKHTLSDSKAGRCDLKKILFSDEKWFNTNDHGMITEFCDVDEYATRRVFDRYAPSVMVWGVIGLGVKKLILLPRGSVTSASYVKNSLTPSKELLRQGVFMQDGARPHTAKNTKKWLDANGIKVLSGWPPRSPDLNPIENLWGIVCKRVAQRQPVSDAELEKFLLEEWDAVPQEMVDNLVLSFKGRLEECVRVDGETIFTNKRNR